jgi:RNA polymerase sigma-70 factor (family 1)
MKTPTPYNDEFALMKNFVSGDKTAFTAIYKEYQDRIFQFANKYVPTEADAEDLTADTFTKLWDHKSEFNSLEHIRAFLHKTVKNACLDFLKHTQTKTDKHSDIFQRLTESGQREFQLEEIRAELMKLVYAEVEKLPAKMREVFLLYYKEGLKPAEIAERLQLTPRTVTNQKVNAVNLLKIALGNNPLLLALLLCLESYALGPQNLSA